MNLNSKDTFKTRVIKLIKRIIFKNQKIQKNWRYNQIGYKNKQTNIYKIHNIWLSS